MAETTLRRRKDRAYGVSYNPIEPAYIGIHFDSLAPADDLLVAALYAADGAYLGDHRQLESGLAPGFKSFFEQSCWVHSASPAAPADGTLVASKNNATLLSWDLAANTVALSGWDPAPHGDGSEADVGGYKIADAGEVWYIRWRNERVEPETFPFQHARYRWQLWRAGLDWSAPLMVRELVREQADFPPGKNRCGVDSLFRCWLTPTAYVCRAALVFTAASGLGGEVVEEVLIRAPRVAGVVEETLLESAEPLAPMWVPGLPSPLAVDEALAYIEDGPGEVALHSIDEAANVADFWPGTGGWNLGGAYLLSHGLSRDASEGLVYSQFRTIRRGPLEGFGADPTHAAAIPAHPVRGDKPKVLFLIV